MHIIKKIGKYFLFPIFFYFIFFIILSFPLILSFPHSLWADTGDGLQNVWNLWWVNKAITQNHTSIWYTDILHYPYGTTLIGHTLNPINGILAIPLLRTFSLFQTYNLILLFAFVGSGLFAFLLAYFLTSGFTGALVAGYIYTFSQFHFAHAQGHLQTVTIQFIPLFILLLWKLLSKPSVILSLGTAVILYFNLLADYYMFFYCLLFTCLFYFWKAYQEKDWLLGHGKGLISYLLIFLVTTFSTSGRIIIALFIQNLRDPFIGAHPAEMFSTDLLSLIIPGGHWRFARLSQSFWEKLPGNIHESSVFLGISVVIMFFYVFLKMLTKIRKKQIKNKERDVFFFFVVFLFFLLLSLGPALQINSEKIAGIIMPYRLMERVIPFISLSGMPVRMMVMVYLAAGIICAYGISKISMKSAINKILILLFLFVLFIEYFPFPMPVTKINIPQYITSLKYMPEAGSVDNSSSPSEALYFQTIHGKPLAYGYLARIPTSVILKDMNINSLIVDQKYDVLCRQYGLKYFVSKNEITAVDCGNN